MWEAKVYVTYKKGVLDPQGSAIEHALKSLGYETVHTVRVGKLIELKLEGTSRESIEKKVKTMCDRLLANPVIEQYNFEVKKV